MKPSPSSIFRRGRRAFTILEVLAVLSVMAIMTGLSITAFSTVTAATTLTTASTQLTDQLRLARQMALSRNCQVEVRFYELSGTDLSDASSNPGWRAIQIFMVKDTGTAAVDKPSYFPRPIQLAVSDALSSFLDSSRPDIIQGRGTDVGVRLPGAGLNYNYRAFRFKPDGSTTLAEPIFATLHSANMPPRGDAPPKNWFTVQVDSLNGQVRTFRP